MTQYSVYISANDQNWELMHSLADFMLFSRCDAEAVSSIWWF